MCEWGKEVGNERVEGMLRGTGMAGVNLGRKLAKSAKSAMKSGEGCFEGLE